MKLKLPYSRPLLIRPEIPADIVTSHSFISIQPWRPVRQEPEPGYGTDVALGTLHPRQILGDSLPLLFPAFRGSHFRHHVPLRPQRRERS